MHEKVRARQEMKDRLDFIKIKRKKEEPVAMPDMIKQSTKTAKMAAFKKIKQGRISKLHERI